MYLPARGGPFALISCLCECAESLLYQLESYGPEAFAAALVGDADSPELIWTHRMRGQRLVPQVRCAARGVGFAL